MSKVVPLHVMKAYWVVKV